MNPKNNPIKIDFLEYKTVLRYVLVIAIALLGGVILKDGIAIFFTLVILYFSATKNLYRAVESFFIWFFISNFFIGQGYITIEFVSKYIAKPSFLLFVIFIFFFNRIPKHLFSAKFIITWLVFLFITLFSSLVHGQSPFGMITISSFFIVYLLIQSSGMNHKQYNQLLNLFVAVAIIQTIVSFLQVAQLIPPPSRMMDDGSGGQFLWEAGLDDVASGTFGAGASYVTSWYAALISLFMLLMWSLTKNWKYLIFMVISFLQFAIVDSKTIMLVTILMLGYLFFYLFKEKKKFKINIVRYTLLLIILSVGTFGFYSAWNSYYVYYGNQTGGSRTSVNEIYQNEAQKSINIVFNNIGNWGKIKGFQYIFEDFSQNNPSEIIWGYGMQGYGYNEKMKYIESKDTPLMQLDNFTNSRSGLIMQFATNGLLGFILFITSMVIWFNYNNKSSNGNCNLIKISLLKIYLPFTFLAAFLYSINFTSIPIITFSAIISIYFKLSNTRT